MTVTIKNSLSFPKLKETTPQSILPSAIVLCKWKPQTVQPGQTSRNESVNNIQKWKAEVTFNFGLVLSSQRAGKNRPDILGVLAELSFIEAYVIQFDVESVNIIHEP